MEVLGSGRSEDADVTRSRPWVVTRDLAVTLWHFGRPHTLIGTTVSVLGLCVVVVAAGSGAPAGRPVLEALAIAWWAGLCANVAVVGLNQLTDVSIDRINKPYLPVAAGTLGPRMAWAIVLILGAAAVFLAAATDPILLATIGLSLALGILYSLPPLRLKRFPLAAALCIVAVRGPIVNLGLAGYFHEAILGTRTVPRAVWPLMVFVSAFSLAIALAKDLPDVVGDRQHAIRTLAVRRGPALVFGQVCRLLAGCAVGMIAVALVGLSGAAAGLLVGWHGAMLALLWRAARRTDPDIVAGVVPFYRLMWRLFCAEYVVFPLACVLAAMGR